MTQAETSQFFAILSLFVWAATTIVLVLALIRRLRPESSLAYLFDDIAKRTVGLAFVVALGTTLGSLYLSEINHYIPCPLCWYQRICMYPLTIALLVGALRRDREVYAYVLPPAFIGMAFAIYHTQLQAFPNQHSSFCKTAEPCTVRYIWEFGFVSIPFMSLSAFTFIIVMMLVLRWKNRTDDLELDPDPADASTPDDDRSLSSQGVA